MRICALLLVFAGCNDSSLPPSSSSPQCSVGRSFPGFTFHVVNQSTATLRAPFGCGGARPITVAGAPIVPFAAVDNEGGPLSCDDVPTTRCDFVSSDCGAGVGMYLAPGASFDVSWDRRTFSLVSVASWCEKAASDCDQCMLGSSFHEAAAQGELTLCDDGMFMSDPPSGSGCTQSARVVDFTFDATRGDTTIVVN